MQQNDNTHEKENTRLWLSVVLEKRGRNTYKNWVEKNPITWPTIYETADGALLHD